MPTRRLLIYLGMVVLPVSLAVYASAYLHRIELQDVWFESDARLARTALELVEWEMNQALPTLLLSAGPLESPDPNARGPVAAAAGDTVLTLEAGTGDLDAVLYLPDAEGGILSSRGSVGAPVAQMLEGVAGYELALYLGGVRAAVTDLDFGPENLDPAVTRRFRVLAEGVPVPLGDGQRAALVPRQGTATDNAFVIALAAPTAPRSGPLTGLFALLAVGLALGLGIVRIGTWIGPLAPTVPSVRRWVERALVVIPVVVAMAAILNVATRFKDDVDLHLADTLGREVALAQVLGPDISAEQIRGVTGFDATRLADGRIVSSSLPGGSLRTQILEVERKSAGRSITGRLETEYGDVVFAASRDEMGATLVLTHTPLPGPVRSFTMRLGGLGLVLLLLVLLFPAYEPAKADG